jgi:endo-1,3(4)-beta-glucanase
MRSAARLFFFFIVGVACLGIGSFLAWKWGCGSGSASGLCPTLPVITSPSTPMTRSQTPVTPPVTNHWYSSLFFKEWGENLVMLPGWAKLKPEGVEIGATVPSFGAKSVMSSLAPLFVVAPSGGQQLVKQEVVEAGEWHLGVRLSGADGGKTFVYLQKGMPTIHVEPTGTALELKPSAGQSFAVTFTETAPQQWVFHPNGASPWYLVSAVEGEAVMVGTTLQLPATGRVAITQLPDEFSQVTLPSATVVAELAACHQHQPFGTRLEITGEAATEMRYELITQTANERLRPAEPVLQTIWPHHRLASPLKTLGTYDSPRGELSLVCAASLPLVLHATPVSEEYVTPAQWAQFPPAKQTQLQTTLRQDWETLAKITPPPGVYFRGKHLKMMIDVWSLAKVMDPGLATEIAGVLDPIIEQDLDKFRFDDAKRLTFFSPTEFGHELGNDHHFQFGYWIYVLSRWHERASDPQKNRIDALLRQLVMEGIQPARDPNTAKDAQARRFGYFDAYEGHSWADGRAFFADGNNQESTSEALQYWASVWWWAKYVGHDDAIAELSKFGLWSEVSSRDAYWLMAENPALRTRSQVPIYSMVFGAKADYATWFSAEDDKIIGIQFLPLFPASREVYRIADEPTRTRLLNLLEKDFPATSQASFAPYLQAVITINGRLVEYGPVHPDEYLPTVVLHLMDESRP